MAVDSPDTRTVENHKAMETIGKKYKKKYKKISENAKTTRVGN